MGTIHDPSLWIDYYPGSLFIAIPNQQPKSQVSVKYLEDIIDLTNWSVCDCLNLELGLIF